MVCGWAKNEGMTLRTYVATVAFYGPDASRASKVVVGIIRTEDGEATEMKKWFSDTTDVRRDPAVNAEILSFIIRDRLAWPSSPAGSVHV
jgi:hypothetical protein